MNKGISAIALAVVLVAGAAQAQDQGVTADSSGCGVGTILFSGQKGIFPQVLAVTTNGSFGNQTFGITSGTLGCNANGVIQSPQKVRMLVVSSLDNLARDVARGEGETLKSLAVAMEVDGADQDAMFATLQSNFTRIFPSENVNADQVLISIESVMAEDVALAHYVRA